jgi:hypothetical protein
MSKAFLIGTVLLAFIAIGVWVVSDLGLLPTSVNVFWDTIERTVPFLQATIMPSMEKYEGTWTVTLRPSAPQSDIASCDTITGVLQVHNGQFSGGIGPFGSALPFHASTTEQGVLAGSFGGTSDRTGTVNATLDNGAGSGTWSDNYNCGGAVTFTKDAPVIDPVQGKVVSVAGDVVLVRNGAVGSASPGLPLYAGDELQVGDGHALLGIGLTLNPVTLSSNTTYVVPEPYR